MDKKAYQEKMEAQLQEWKADLEKLEAQAKKKSADTAPVSGSWSIAPKPVK